MTEKKVCPICSFENTTLNINKCPQCDSDLAPFSVLDSLSAEEEKKIRVRLELGAPSYLMLLLLFILLIGVVVFQFIRLKQLDLEYKNNLEVVNKQVTIVNKDLTAEIVSLNLALEKYVLEQKNFQSEYLQSQRELKFDVYPIQKGDTLRKISQRLYHTGDYYSVLILFNPWIKSAGLKEGRKIKILTDVNIVESIYRNVIKADR
ncbi:MAG: LysM domain-containing protein [Elusimicrobiota bacterium]